jgi:hypothetical protein
MAAWESLAASTSTFQPGFAAASGCFSIQVANPSFSHKSSHQRIVTRSPNH